MPDDRIVGIPPSSSDTLLRSWGYDLVAEYVEMVVRVGFHPDHPVIELATGSGRMTAVLAHLGFRVVTGDRTQDQHQRVLDRLTPSHIADVSFVSLEISRLPFADRSIRNVACVNTLHELDDPRTALSEILRVMHPEGRIVLADFNEQGFKVMQRLEHAIYGRDHQRGTLPMAEAKDILRAKGFTLEQYDLALNVVAVASQNPASILLDS